MCQCPLGLISHFYNRYFALWVPYALRKCQCPLGLISHFYGWKVSGGDPRSFTGVNALSGWYLISTIGQAILFSIKSHLCQCPLGLISHFYNHEDVFYIFVIDSVNALSGWYLISTVPLQKPRFYAVSRACFCRYLSEYSDNSCFSCMLTFWTYLMRCTYPWHWIKYSTK